MKTSKISGRYAKALFDFAIEQNLVEPIFADMNLINQTYVTSPDFAVAMRSPIIRPDKKIKIFSEIFKEQINTITMNYLSIIFKKGRELYIHDIVYQFVHLYKAHHNIQEVVVITPMPITEEIRKKLISQLGMQINATVELIEKTDPSLVGGMVVKLGDQLIDTSISGKIKRLEQEFSTNIYSKAY